MDYTVGYNWAATRRHLVRTSDLKPNHHRIGVYSRTLCQTNVQSEESYLERMRRTGAVVDINRLSELPMCKHCKRIAGETGPTMITDLKQLLEYPPGSVFTDRIGVVCMIDSFHSENVLLIGPETAPFYGDHILEKWGPLEFQWAPKKEK